MWSKSLTLLLSIFFGWVSTVALTASPTFPQIRVRCGGPQYVDSQGLLWAADYSYSGSTETYSTTHPVSGTTLTALYQDERFGESFQYSFSVPNGTYSVALKFAELYFSAAGQRVFNVAIDDHQVLSNLDIFAVTGGQYRAFRPSFSATVTNGQIVIQFSASVNNAKIDAIEITQLSASSTQSPVGISLFPPSATLAGGGSAQFAATVTGSSNTAATWSISPNVGSIVNGLYRAPTTIAAAQSITLTATSSADATQSATATINLVAPPAVVSPATPTATTINLPIEAIGRDGTTSAISFPIPPGANLSGQLQLWMQIHGLRYDTEASVQVNNSAWFPISNSTVTLLGSAAAFGGIGGGSHTLQMTVNLPAGLITPGTNTVTFRFNGTDGVVSGYRVLAFNIQSAGSNLLSSSLFVNEDPDTWQPPSTAASDIAAGLAIFQGAALTTPTTAGAQPILAHCSDCHTQDGRDLKYFNYSNNSIVARAQFHGLTAQQGNQIASYIRSLNLPNPGRPWNPPYQPGPGLDSQPVANWAAGAGLDAVLDNDAQMQPYLAPGGSTAGWSASSYLNPREIPIALQLPDWNSWLPIVHPKDAFGANFINSNLNLLFPTIRNDLAPNSPVAYNIALGAFHNWFVASEYFLTPIIVSAAWDANLRTDVYSVALWEMVKMWEVNQEFGLEGMPQVPFGAAADSRGWYGDTAFGTAPNMLHIPAGPGLANGSQVVGAYLSLIWYHVQLMLNDGQGTQTAHTPIDYGYASGYIENLLAGQAGLPGIMLELEWEIKALQEVTLSGIGPQEGGNGWHPVETSMGVLVNPAWLPLWSGTSPATETTLMQAYTQAWFDQASQYTPAQYYQGGWASATDNPATLDFELTFGGQLWFSLPRLRYYGVSPALTNQIAAWAATIWPQGNWNLNNAATCSSDTNCTSGY